MQHEFAEIVWVHAIGILRGIDQADDRVLVDAARQRQLHDVAGAGRILVQVAHRSGDVIETRVGGKVAPDGTDADLRTVGMLARDVFHRTGILPDQQRSQTGDDAVLLQCRNTFRQVRLDLGRDPLAIEFDGHVRPSLEFVHSS